MPRTVRPSRRIASALVGAVVCIFLAGCQTTRPQVARHTIRRVPGESIVVARVLIPAGLSGLWGGREVDSLRLTIQTEGTQAVRPTPVTPAEYLLASLPPGRYRITGWEARAERATNFGSLDVRFDVPQTDRLYYLGTLVFDPQTTERYRLRVDDEYDAAMRYLTADHSHLTGPYERRLLTFPLPAQQR